MHDLKFSEARMPLFLRQIFRKIGRALVFKFWQKRNDTMQS